jgi:hypothetical protein
LSRSKFVLLSVVAFLAAPSLPLIPAKAGTQGRSERTSPQNGAAAPHRIHAAHVVSPVLDPGLRRGERKGKGYDVRAKHALKTLDDPYVEPAIPQIAQDAAAAGDTSLQPVN